MPTEMFTEYTEHNEKQLYEETLKVVKTQEEKIYGNAKRALRDTHAKSHAAVKAHLEVLDFDEDAIKQGLAERTKLPDTLIEQISVKQGIFSKPGRYPVWLRFANGRPNVKPDRVPDTRAMSVKIINVEGDRLPDTYQDNVQDIITQNGSIFFISNIAYYLSFLKAAYKLPLFTLLWLIFHLRQFFALKRITGFAPKSLLTERYWSGSAYALGLPKTEGVCPDVASATYPAVIKYAFTPCMPEEPFLDKPREKIDLPKSQIPENYYREDLIERLARPDAKYCWNVGIQFQTTPEMSIDDIIVDWPEKESPFFTVARLVVEHQDIDFEKQYNFVEDLTYSPWNGLQVHRPVGALNRLRHHVYPLIAAYRLKKRGVKIDVMTGNENPN